MNTFPNVSFIIPAYNCAGTIAEAIESVFNGNFQNGDEIIVVDDFSSDNTADVVDSYAKKHSSIRMLRHQVNKGTAAASRNTGIEQVNNELVFCLDSDNILAPQSITSLKDYLVSQQADAAAFGELWYFSEDISKITHKWIFRDTITLSDALAGYYWPGPSGNYLFTRSSWKKAGRYFEPSLENQTLDSWIFGIRQLGTGQKMVTLQGTGYFHRYGHQSHYVRNSQTGNISLSALIGIIPFLSQLEEVDVDYIFSKAERLIWMDKLGERPIRVKNQLLGQTGRMCQLIMHSEQNNLDARNAPVFSLKNFIRSLIKK